jgi:hypothetical protein
VWVNITLDNRATVDYNVTLLYNLSDSSYQTQYVTCSETIYRVPPGHLTVSGWLFVAAEATVANLELTITASRNQQPRLSPSVQPSQQPNPTSNYTLQLPSVQLLQAGMAWAAPAGGKVLYVDWKDCWLVHGSNDGASWGPWPNVAYMDSWRNTISNILQTNGFKSITYAGDLPSNLDGYNLVILEASFGINPTDAPVLANFVANGGGVVMMDGTPCYLNAYCRDWWPGRFGGANLTSIAAWFGYKTYKNLAAAAYPSFDHPVGTSLHTTDQLYFISGSAAYWQAAESVADPVDDNTQVIAQYEAGNHTSPFTVSSPLNYPSPFAFTHQFGAGRLFWQADFWPFLTTSEIASATHPPFLFTAPPTQFG